MSALTAADVWAVGDYIEAETPTQVVNTLIVHWNGTTWSQVPSPNPSSTVNELYDVSVRSGTDAWAVGWYLDDATHRSRRLILHWDGTIWSQVPSPNPRLGGILLGISARSARDAWAVGVEYPGRGKDSLILHWDGSSWSRSTGPEVNVLHRVCAISATDAWAIGARSRWFLHWDGTRWSKVVSHSPSTIVWGLTALSKTDAWAVGFHTNDVGAYWPVALHWGGARWSRITTPTTGRILLAVSGTRPRNVWAVGDVGAVRTKLKTVAYHWDGSAWSTVKTPNPSSTANSLYDVSARSGTDAWAVGSYYDESTGVGSVLILHWDGTRWRQA